MKRETTWLMMMKETMRDCEVVAAENTASWRTLGVVRAILLSKTYGPSIPTQAVQARLSLSALKERIWSEVAADCWESWLQRGDARLTTLTDSIRLLEVATEICPSCSCSRR